MYPLEIKNLTKLYTSNKGIKDINLKLNEKECVAIIGKSGSGKSTLLKTILNIINKDSGEVYFYNEPLNKDYEAIMNIVGYLKDSPNDYPNLTIINFIKIVNRYYNLDYTNDILEYLDEFNLNKDNKISELSSGENQKLSLILALFYKPKILLLDEPTNHLDQITITKLQNILKKLKYEGTSILICSHSLNFILNLADRIYLLNDFKLIDIKDELLKKDYKKITITSNYNLTFKDLNIKGFNRLNIINNSANFIYSGDFNFLLKKLQSLDIIDLTIENPSVDDILGGLINGL